MASAIEIIKIITALVPTYDGNGEKLASIVAALNACKSLINEENKKWQLTLYYQDSKVKLDQRSIILPMMLTKSYKN